MIPTHDLPLTTPAAPRRAPAELRAMRRRFLAAILMMSGLGVTGLSGCGNGYGYGYGECADSGFFGSGYDYYDVVERYYLQVEGETCPVVTGLSDFDDNDYNYTNCSDAVLTDETPRGSGWTVCTYSVVCPEFETTGSASVFNGESCPETMAVDDSELDVIPLDYDDGSFDYYEGYDTCRDFELVDQNGSICTYEMECQPWSCCGYGRPYLDHDAKPVTTAVTDDPAWRVPVAVSLGGLTEREREALAAFWRKNAVAEHSSVAGFHRFALDLLAHGAPPELLLEAQRAASQEVRHAIACFSLASRYAGVVQGPAPMPLGDSAPVARSLAELAVWTTRDGAVGETIAAHLAARARDRATDAVVRDKLATIVRDETEHAELAWKTLAWALEVGGDDVRRAVMACINSIAPDPVPEAWTSAGLVAHGLLPAAEQTAAIRQCIDEVIRPVAASLLARDLAA